MKKYICLIFLFVSFAFALTAKEVALLTIGNSFAESLSSYLEKVSESVPGCKLTFGKANHGGCELRRHWSYVEKEEASPNVKLYRNKTMTLKDILESCDWDFVSIQQASHESWIPETYQPYAKNLRDYVAKYAPSAEIIMQQTWSYRSDDPRLTDFNPDGRWKINQGEMHRRAREAYRKTASELGLRVVPMGDAVWIYRSQEKKPFKPFSPKELESFKYPDLPPNDGDVVGNFKWRDVKLSGGKHSKSVKKLLADCIHLNKRGEYLQACLWFGFLFDKSPKEIAYKPDWMTESDAEYLKDVAEKALNESTLPVKKTLK